MAEVNDQQAVGVLVGYVSVMAPNLRLLPNRSIVRHIKQTIRMVGIGNVYNRQARLYSNQCIFFVVDSISVTPQVAQYSGILHIASVRNVLAEGRRREEQAKDRQLGKEFFHP